MPVCSGVAPCLSSLPKTRAERTGLDRTAAHVNFNARDGACQCFASGFALISKYLYLFFSTPSIAIASSSSSSSFSDFSDYTSARTQTIHTIHRQSTDNPQTIHRQSTGNPDNPQTIHMRIADTHILITHSQLANENTETKAQNTRKTENKRVQKQTHREYSTATWGSRLVATATSPPRFFFSPHLIPLLSLFPPRYLVQQQQQRLIDARHVLLAVADADQSAAGPGHGR